MTELFLEEGHSIFTFKEGDIIIRCKPAELKTIKYNENLMIEEEVIYNISKSFTEEPIKFKCILNNLIYFEYGKSLGLTYKISTVSLRDYSDNWKLYELPSGISYKDLGLDF